MLQVRYHQRFKGVDEVLLFAGSMQELGEVRSFFENWRGEKLEFIGALKRSHEIYIYGINKLFLEIDEKIPSSISGIDSSDMFLLLTKADKDRIVGLIDGLENFAKPGHQYFRTRGQSIELMFAKDEYPLPGTQDL